MGATTTDTAGAGVRQGFNPRAHEGRDIRNVAAMQWLSVSTHAPTRGATVLSYGPSMDKRFQPTRPRGARQETMSVRVIVVSFNPRAHEGRDSDRLTCASYWCVSTHAPTRGATPEKRLLRHEYAVSTHAPTRGATHATHGCHVLRVVSTHAPTRGAT